MHMDVDAFYAPSECHGLVSKGEAQRARQARRHAVAVSGVSARELRMIGRRLSGRAQERLMYACLDRVSPYACK